jgi:DNA invertase Pin-like site-specific DNA recombinase
MPDKLPPPTQTLPPLERRLVSYLHSPTGPERRRHHGLTLQDSKTRTWAIDNGARVMKVHRDEGVPATVDRPGLLRALEDVQAKRAGGVVVESLARIAGDVVTQEAYRAAVVKAGGQLHSVDPGDVDALGPTPGPDRLALRQLLTVVDYLERATVRARLEAGRQRKAAQGGYVGGRPPTGFRAVGGALMAHGREQAAIARALELRSVGHTYREVAGILGSEGYRTKDGRAEWHPETVRRLCLRVFPEAATGEPGPWNGYDLGHADPDWPTAAGDAVPSTES